MSIASGEKSENRLSVRSVKDCVPSRRSVDYSVTQLPQVPLPLQAMVPCKAKSSVPDAVAHVCAHSIVGKPFVKISNGLLAPLPELCFVQLAQTLSLPELVHAGNALCGTFYIDPTQPGGLGSRLPLTNVSRIAAFLRKNPGLHGSKAARRALRWVRDGFASPPESFMWLVLGLEHRDGGYALSGLKVNERLNMSRKAAGIANRTTLVPDLCAPEARLSIEYDSNAEHLSARQLTLDATKRMALEADGYKVITVTALQLRDCREMSSVAKEAARRLGLRFRVQSSAFAVQQRRLFALGWSLDAYFRESWLRPKGKDCGVAMSGKTFALGGYRLPSKTRVS